jgi:uncharacterized membrane protein
MKKIVDFIKTTALGGLVLIVPLAVMAIAFGYVISLLVKLNKEASALLPYEIASHPAAVVTLAVGTLILVCFLAGLMLKTGFGERLATQLEGFLVSKLPMYGVIKNLARRVTGDEVLQFTPVEVNLYGSDARMLAFLIEALPDDRYAVFVPSAPTLTIGNVFVLPAGSVTLLNKPAKLAIDAITQWGTGAALLYQEDASNDRSTEHQEQAPTP